MASTAANNLWVVVLLFWNPAEHCIAWANCFFGVKVAAVLSSARLVAWSVVSGRKENVLHRAVKIL
jgi:hypothetical protein